MIPKNCLSCKRLEDQGAQSPRLEYLNKFKSNNQKTVLYLDYTIDNICNFQCRSCKPLYSKLLEKEFSSLAIPFIKIDEDHDKKCRSEESIISKLDDNAFITITGGEPFISTTTLAFINKLSEQRDTSSMSIRFFTNGSKVPTWLADVFRDFKFVEIMISLDASSDLAHYLRHPCNWQEIVKNIQSYILLHKQFGNSEISFHTVLQAANMFGIDELINELSQFKEEIPFVPNFTVLAHPSFMRPSSLPNKIFTSECIGLINSLTELKKKVTENEHHFINNKNLSSLIAILHAQSTLNNESDFLKFTAHYKRVDKYRNQSIEKVIPSLFKRKTI